MKEKSTSLKSNLKKVDSHKNDKKDYEDIPELPKDFFTKGQLYQKGKPVERKGRGKQKKPVKIQKSFRFDRDVIDFFMKDGDGWQTRMNDVLAAHVKKSKKKRKGT